MRVPPPRTEAGYAQGQDPKRSAHVPFESRHWLPGGPHHLGRDHVPRGYAIKVRTPMKDTMIPKDRNGICGCAASPPICCQAMPSSIASWWPFSLSKYKSTRPCTPNYGKTTNVRPGASYIARGCGGPPSCGRRNKYRTRTGDGPRHCQLPGHSHQGATAVAVDSHRPGCGGEIQAPHGVCGAHVPLAPAQGAPILLA